MKHYSKISKITLVLLSISIVLNSLFLSRYDKWPIDLFYYMSFFSVIFMMDFLFFELYSEKNAYKHHSHFCVFPITRFKLLLLELLNYLKRWELVIYLVSILFFIIHFYYLNDANTSIALVVVAYLFQTLYLVSLMLLLKNLNRKSNSDEKIRSLVLSFVFGSILLTVFSERSHFIAIFFYSFPLINGFLPFLISKTCFFISLIIVATSIVSLYINVKRRFYTWPLY